MRNYSVMYPHHIVLCSFLAVNLFNSLWSAGAQEPPAPLRRFEGPSQDTPDSNVLFLQPVKAPHHAEDDHIDHLESHHVTTIKLPDDGDFMFFAVLVNGTTVQLTHVNVTEHDHGKVLFSTPVGKFVTDKFEVVLGDEPPPPKPLGHAAQLMQIRQNGKSGVFFKTPHGGLALLDARSILPSHEMIQHFNDKIAHIIHSINEGFHRAYEKLKSFLKHHQCKRQIKLISFPLLISILVTTVLNPLTQVALTSSSVIIASVHGPYGMMFLLSESYYISV